jgi:hypothetical protein
MNGFDPPVLESGGDSTASEFDGTTATIESGVSIRRYVNLVKADLPADSAKIDFTGWPELAISLAVAFETFCLAA